MNVKLTPGNFPSGSVKLGLCRGTGVILGQGPKIPHALWPKKKKERNLKKKKKKKINTKVKSEGGG